MALPFTYVIGLEVHVELNTRTKMFCRCANQPFGSQPNQHTCPVCAGLPGSLPVPNFEAVKKTILVGKALGSTIPEFSKWDRKHYFYPDSPRGYQISQYDFPLCVGGSLELLNDLGKAEKAVRFNRVHLEDDAGKLLHGDRPGYSQVDLNRAGVPLIEMVTEPDITSPEQARRFMQELRLLVRTLGVSEADMEKGQMRCDANISIKFDYEGQAVWTPITEIKNVNSTRGVERGLTIEAQRLYDEWIAGGPVRTRKNKLTAGWDEDHQTVTVQRAKEEANDYRYFPEPDLPPLMVYEVPELHPDAQVVPELPNDRRKRYLEYSLLMADVEVLLADVNRLERFEAMRHTSPDRAKLIANWLINAPACLELADADILELIALTADGRLAFAKVKPVLEEIATLRKEGDSLEKILSERHLLQEHDEAVVQLAVREVLEAQQVAVEQYRSGETKVLGFLVGQVLQKCKGKAVAAKVQEAMIAALTPSSSK